jgi:two-component system, LytTR family, sensor kinase
MRARAYAAVWLGWTALAVFYAVTTSLTYASTGRPANWSITFQRSLSEYWLWALLTPAVIWLARRFPLFGPRRWVHLVLHLALGAGSALFKTIADREIFAMLSGFRMYFLLSTLSLQFTIYFAIVAASHGFEYYRRSREREQLEARLAEARLQLLSMQLQPHFLFNTLNTIAELVHDDPEAADQMISGLSDLLRRTLDLGDAQEITLDEEMDALSRYLDIQKIRFGDRLQVDIEAPPELRDANVPPLLLQPLVENSIRHGLAARTTAGRIQIRVGRTDAMLVIDVLDDGDGVTQEAVGTRRGIGLNNVRTRLETMYGSAATFTMSREAGAGTRVSIGIPYHSGAPR